MPKTRDPVAARLADEVIEPTTKRPEDPDTEPPSVVLPETLRYPDDSTPVVACTVVPESDVATGRFVRDEPSPANEVAVTAPVTASVLLNVAAPST
tara:strand:- start:61 stop:348 length:288 start_codon:yes stop_codon:yes gene_type:complete